MVEADKVLGKTAIACFHVEISGQKKIRPAPERRIRSVGVRYLCVLTGAVLDLKLQIGFDGFPDAKPLFISSLPNDASRNAHGQRVRRYLKTFPADRAGR